MAESTESFHEENVMLASAAATLADIHGSGVGPPLNEIDPVSAQVIHFGENFSINQLFSSPLFPSLFSFR
jgi:glutamate 5-kinase